MYSSEEPSGPFMPMKTKPRSSTGASSLGSTLSSTAAIAVAAIVPPMTSQGRRIARRRLRSYHADSRWKKSSTVTAMRERCAPPANSFDVIIGVSVSAMSDENATAAAMVKPNSRNSVPTLPDRNDMGRNTATSTIVVATTAKPISREPSTEAISAGSPFSMRR